jgi:periplasmic protein TonB
MPEFPGGIDSLKVFIGNNLMWPNTEVDFAGTVYIPVIVETDGSLTIKKVIRGIENSADAEALKVIDNMPKWKAGKCTGTDVPVRYIIPVKFVLKLIQQ